MAPTKTSTAVAQPVTTATPPSAEPPQFQPKPSTGLPGWLKGCLVGCLVILVLLGIAGAVGYWYVSTKILTPERRELLKQATELSKSMNPKDIENLQSFMEKMQKGDLKLTAEQQAQAEALGKKLDSGDFDAQTADDLVTLMASIDPQTFGDTTKWKTNLKTALPFIQNLMKEAKKLEGPSGAKMSATVEPTPEE